MVEYGSLVCGLIHNRRSHPYGVTAFDSLLVLLGIVHIDFMRTCTDTAIKIIVSR
jgi:hypothetical protein